MELREIINTKTKQDIIDTLLIIAKDNSINLSQYFIETFEPSQNAVDVFNYYNSKKLKTTRELSPKLTRLIDKNIKLFSFDGVKQLIDRYAQIVFDARYYFSYKWNLEEFLARKEGIASFTDNGNKWIDYISKRPKINIDEYFNATWEMYTNKSGRESAKEEYEKKFIGKNEIDGKKLANIIYIKAKQYCENTDEDYIMKFQNWLRAEVPN